MSPDRHDARAEALRAEAEAPMLGRLQALADGLLGVRGSRDQAWRWLLGLAAAIAALLAVAPATTLSAFMADGLFMIDQSWRLATGQTPNLDFPTPLGPVFYGLVRMASAAGGVGPGVVRWTGAVGAALLAAPLMWLALRRLPPVTAWCYAALFLLLPAAPRMIDGFVVSFAFLAPYNSVGWTMFALVALAAFPRRGSGRERGAALEAGLLGAVAALAALLKLSTGVACLAVLAGAAADRATRRTALTALGVAAALLAAAWLGAPARLSAYLADNAALMGAASFGARAKVRATLAVMEFTVPFACLLGGFWWLERCRAAGAVPAVAAWRVAVVTLAACANALNNHDLSPIWLVFAFLALQNALLFELPSDAAPAWRRVRALIVAAPLLGMAAWHGGGSAASLALHAVAGFAAEPMFKTGAPNAQGLRIIGEREPWPKRPDEPLGLWPYAESLDEAAALLRDAGPAADNVLVVDRAATPAWLAGRRVARGAPAWFDPKRTISPEVHPAEEAMLGGADAVLVPKVAIDPGLTELFLKLYRSELETRFPHRRESEHWTLHLRWDPAARR